MQTIKIGIIGLGAMGAKHLSVYSSIPQTKVVGITDINLERAKTFSEKYGNIPFFNDYEKMIEKTKPDAVVIAVPDAAHAKPVKTALAVGVHVLVEKPLATSLTDANDMIAFAKECNKILMVNFTHRWVPAYFKAKQVARTGELGEIVMAYAKKNDPINVVRQWPWLKDSSPAAFLSSHDIDLVRWFLGCEAKSVFARGHKSVLKKEFGYDTWDCIQASVEFENGAITVFESSFIYPAKFPTYTDSYIQLSFEKGVIQMPRLSEGFEIATNESYELPKIGIAIDYDGDIQGAFRMAAEHFIHCVVTGEEPITSGWHSRQVSEIVEGIHRSLDSGKIISLPITDSENSNV